MPQDSPGARIERPPDALSGSEARARALDACIDALAVSSRRPADAPPVAVPAIRHVLACIGEGDATDVLSWARELGRTLDARVTLLHVVRLVPSPSIHPVAGPIGIGAPLVLGPSEEPARRERATRVLREAAREVEADVARVDTLYQEGQPADEIVRVARDQAVDLVVLGAHEGGALSRLLLGSTSDQVKDRAPCDVLIARGPAVAGPVLAAVDGSVASRRAALLADGIARRWGATLHLIHVLPHAWHRRSDDRVVEELRARTLAGVEFDLRLGDPRGTILGAVRGVDARLVALGRRGLGGLRGLVTGSVGRALAHGSPTSVLLARAPGED